MRDANTSFARSLWAGPNASQIVRFLDLADHAGGTWTGLSGPLRGEIERFERMQIAAAWAATMGAGQVRVERRQDFLVRTAVTSILFPLEELEDRLLGYIEQRGLPALFHHVVRELAERPGTEPGSVLGAGDRCKVTAFALEDGLRGLDASEADAPEQLLALYLGQTARLQQLARVDALPFGATGLALLWVAALHGLGNQPSELDSTEHYADD